MKFVSGNLLFIQNERIAQLSRPTKYLWLGTCKYLFGMVFVKPKFQLVKRDS